MPTIQGHTISHAPSMTLIHSSHERKTVSVSNSAKITKTPEITAIFVAVESRSNRRAHGEIHNQRPSSQLHQSSHCFGSETAIVAPVKSAIISVLDEAGCSNRRRELVTFRYYEFGRSVSRYPLAPRRQSKRFQLTAGSFGADRVVKAQTDIRIRTLPRKPIG